DTIMVKRKADWTPTMEQRAALPAYSGSLVLLRGLPNFFRIVAAHCRPRRASRFLLTCALLLTVASPAFAFLALVLKSLEPSRARASCPRWITPSIGWSLPTN